MLARTQSGPVGLICDPLSREAFSLFGLGDPADWGCFSVVE